MFLYVGEYLCDFISFLENREYLLKKYLWKEKSGKENLKELIYLGICLPSCVCDREGERKRGREKETEEKEREK